MAYEDSASAAVTQLLDRLAWINAREQARALLPFWLLALLVALLYPYSPHFALVDLAAFTALVAFGSVSQSYQLLLAAAWGPRWSSVGRGMLVGVGLVYASMFLVMLTGSLVGPVVAGCLGFGGLLGLPLIYRRLAIYRLSRLAPEAAPPRRVSSGWAAGLGRLNPILGLTAPRLSQLALALLVVLPGVSAAQDCAGPMGDPLAMGIMLHIVGFLTTAILALAVFLHVYSGPQSL